MSDADQRAGCISGLRALADLLERHTELELPYQGSGKGLEIIPVGRDAQREQLAAWARVLADKTEDASAPKDLFALRGRVGGLRVDVLCNRASVEGVEWQHPELEWPADWPPQVGDEWRDALGYRWFAVRGRFGGVGMICPSDGPAYWTDLDEVLGEFGPMTRVYRPGDDTAGGAR